MNDKPKSSKRSMRRWIFWLLTILRHLLVPLLCVLAVLVGVGVGYTVLGGQDPADIGHGSTWKHLIDLVFG